MITCPLSDIRTNHSSLPEIIHTHANTVKVKAGKAKEKKPPNFKSVANSQEKDTEMKQFTPSQERGEQD